MHSFSKHPQKAILIWLLMSCFFVLLMVAVGGITRLTESGLSIVKWEPIKGAIPPLTEEHWQSEFLHYQESPQYKKVNQGMSLDDFKTIYFWEWFHRFLGRFLGLIFFIPYFIFLVRKKLSPYLKWNGFLILCLGGLQGFMGWYMVKSGLVDKPEVSHYRLAMHLILAFFIAAYLFYVFLRTFLGEGFLRLKMEKNMWSFLLDRSVSVFTWVLALQIIYGAFLAKLKGGLYYNTYPKMGMHWLPPELFIFSPLMNDLLENPVTVQWVHRMCGLTLLVLGAAILWMVLKKFHKSVLLKKITLVWASLLGMQFLLGILTLIYVIPLHLAVIHQVCASLLVLATTALVFIRDQSQN